MKLYLYDQEGNFLFEGTKAACRNFVQKTQPAFVKTEFKRLPEREKQVVVENEPFNEDDDDNNFFVTKDE